MKNIVLIGLPSAGKSTIGVILAKSLGMNFIDTDIIIQENTGCLLQAILNEDGPEKFMEIEEQSILGLSASNAIIATGGSVVYSHDAMNHLRSDSIVVYLKISFREMSKRLKNIKTRGIVLIPGQSLRDMYNQRIPLYESYADITIDCSNKNFENVVGKVVKEIEKESSKVLSDRCDA